MATMAVSKLVGLRLDWAVAKCEGLLDGPGKLENIAEWFALFSVAYSTDWAQGGPIIRRERIAIVWDTDSPDGAVSWKFGHKFRQEGETELIAAMRCYVASKLGNTVDIPDELLAE